jgi:predicted nuclease of predicted toxin-antitoxin system
VTAPRFLIDENLSPALAEPARERGFEAMHVNHLGLRSNRLASPALLNCPSS